MHPATASRALNPATRRLVNADTARRVIKVAESLGYQPNPIARSLKTAQVRHHRPGHPRPHQPAVPADRARHRGRARAGRLQRLDRQHRQRPGPRARPDRARCARGRSRASSSRPRGCDHPLLEQLHARGHADGAGQPAAGRARPPVGHAGRRHRHRSSPSSTSRPRATGGSPTWPGPSDTSTGVARARAFRARRARPRPRRRPGAGRRVRLLDRGGRRAGAARRCSTPAPIHRDRRRQRPDRARLLRRVRRARHRPARTTSASSASTTCRSSTSCGRR